MIYILESKFKTQLIKELEETFPGCVILSGDANHTQGISDLIILFEDKWAALETKRSAKAPKRPNQEYYVNKFGRMSYAAFVFPDNKETVMRELQSALKPSRASRLSKRQ